MFLFSKNEDGTMKNNQKLHTKRCQLYIFDLSIGIGFHESFKQLICQRFVSWVFVGFPYNDHRGRRIKWQSVRNPPLLFPIVVHSMETLLRLLHAYATR